MMIELLAAPLADLKNARRESCMSINVVPPPGVSYSTYQEMLAKKLTPELRPSAERIFCVYAPMLFAPDFVNHSCHKSRPIIKFRSASTELHATAMSGKPLWV